MKTILVTGTNRSGTTWVGKMLLLSGQVMELYEPFNHRFDEAQEGVPIPFDCHYHYVTLSETPAMRKYMNDRIARQITKEYKEEGKTLKLGIQTLKNWVNIQIGRRKVLFKDPIAVLSAQWLEQYYGSKVLVLIRHPAAYVASIKRLNWPMSPKMFTSQPEFVKTLPQALAEELNEHVKHQSDEWRFDLDNTIMCWKVMNQAILQYKRDKPNWLFVRHEDLSHNYLEEFKRIYDAFGLTWSDRVEEKIDEHCRPSNIKDPAKEVHILKRDSRSTTQLWKTILTAEEIREVYSSTQSIAQNFYSDKEWD